MNYQEFLSLVANWAASFTAAFAAFAAFASAWFWGERCKKRVKLENYLKKQKASGADKGQRSLLHLMRHLSMTEADIMNAAFRSNRVEPKVKKDEDGFADSLFFEYTGK